MTLSNTKGVDILVSNQSLESLYKVEVKTTEKKPIRESLFGEKPAHCWMMSAKHERIRDRNLFYCFVALQSATTLPKFFIVPSSYVADYVRDQHLTWLASRKKEVAMTTLRRFRIPIDDPHKFENRREGKNERESDFLARAGQWEGKAAAFAAETLS